ncbi:MAG: heme A synthase [Ktedonobacteraceae bacterium]|nr:heme A synthase [Ktedonobacteraceae bacterium]
MLTNRLMKILAIITTFGAYVMIVLGVLVTTTGSGKGCGNSWPFCHGEIIPGTLTIQGVTEYSHRIMSSADGFLVLVLTVWSWLAYRKDRLIKLYAFLSLFFVIAQGALGALTVIYEGTFLLNWLLSIHFGLSLIAFASVVLLTARLFELGRSRLVKAPLPISKGLQFSLWGLTIYTYLVVYTGAYVQHTGAVGGCGYQFPGCGSTYLPSFTQLAGIQVLHRYAAGLLWVWTLLLLIVVLRRYRTQRVLVAGLWWSLALVTLQAISGITNVLTMGQMVLALIHATLVSLYFSVLSYLCAQVGRPGRHMQAEQEQPVAGQPGSPAIASRHG